MSPLSHIPSTPPPSDPEFPNKLFRVKPENTRKPVADSEQPLTKTSSIHLSRDSQDISTRRKQMNDLPEIREDRILQLQRAIENETYSVSAEQLVEKLIREL
ncbi:MAG: flagellar biosynthesis anti-sigma factor FlgM [Nitrospirales bacterium]